MESDTWNGNSVRIGCFFQGIADSSIDSSRLAIRKRKGDVHSGEVGHAFNSYVLSGETGFQRMKRQGTRNHEVCWENVPQREERECRQGLRRRQRCESILLGNGEGVMSRNVREWIGLCDLSSM